jgi:outer membrane protein assembly factor BamB
LHSGIHAPIEYGPVEHGALAAFKVKEDKGKFSLEPSWISHDMNIPDPPVIANGVVFGYGSGESVTLHWPDPAHITGSAGRIAESTHAVLYALDAQTGKELWSSGNQIASWNHFSGISVANGRVYIGTYDGYEY